MVMRGTSLGARLGAWRVAAAVRGCCWGTGHRIGTRGRRGKSRGGAGGRAVSVLWVVGAARAAIMSPSWLGTAAGAGAAAARPRRVRNDIKIVTVRPRRAAGGWRHGAAWLHHGPWRRRGPTLTWWRRGVRLRVRAAWQQRGTSEARIWGCPSAGSGGGCSAASGGRHMAAPLPPTPHPHATPPQPAVALTREARLPKFPPNDGGTCGEHGQGGARVSGDAAEQVGCPPATPMATPSPPPPGPPHFSSRPLTLAPGCP